MDIPDGWVVVVSVLLLFSCVTGSAQAVVWPGRDWTVASPESQGIARNAVDEVARIALQHGGGSGCIVRNGMIIGEWGPADRLADIKSATKGSFGTTLLGIAFDRNLIHLDDFVLTHYPDMKAGIAKETGLDDPSERLGEVTIRHLATMTAGFDDGRPPRLVYRPGTSGIYSNDTSNMLAELLTIRFGEDLAAVARRLLMDQIGAPPGEWAWRENAYRSATVHNLPSREFASGITITHRTLARIGLLYLRGGEWNGRRIVSKAFLAAATRPTELPAPWPYYGFYWGTNANGAYPEIPRDTFWALGLGDSFVLACPSLDIVLVRLGVGSTASQLPDLSLSPESEPTVRSVDWGGRVAGLFRPIVRDLRAPYPSSPVIQSIVWDPADRILRLAPDSDNWPLTWSDDTLIGAYGDGRGFEPVVPEKLSMGLTRIEGDPPSVRGTNLRAPTLERKGDGKAGIKASGLLRIGGVLYLLARNAGNSRLAWSEDGGATWRWAD